MWVARTLRPGHGLALTDRALDVKLVFEYWVYDKTAYISVHGGEPLKGFIVDRWNDERHYLAGDVWLEFYKNNSGGTLRAGISVFAPETLLIQRFHYEETPEMPRLFSDGRYGRRDVNL